MRSSPTVLLRAVALGLTLASAQLGWAAGGARGAAMATKVKAHMEMLQRKLTQQTEINDLIRNPGSHTEHLHLLIDFEQRFGRGAAGVTLAETKDGILEARFDGIRVVDPAGNARAAEVTDLARAGITDRATFESAMRRRLHEVAGVKKGTASEEKAIAALQEKISDADTLVSKLAQHTDVELLSEHHVGVVVTRGAATNGQIAISGKRGDEIRIDTNGYQNIVLAKDGEQSPVSYGDLLRHGITSSKALDAHMAKLVVRTAGLKGSGTNAKLYAKAREKLYTQINETQALEQAIGHYDNDKLSLIREIDAAIPGRGDRPVMLVQSKAGELQVRNNGGYEKLFIIDKTSPEGRLATLSELRQFGILKPAHLDAALDKALLRIAPEDFPL